MPGADRATVTTVSVTGRGTGQTYKRGTQMPSTCVLGWLSS